MSYEPTTWKAGDTVTSAKLNKLEQGVAGAGSGILVVHNVEGTLDKTWQEIHDGGVAVVVETDQSGNVQYDYVTGVHVNAETYFVNGSSLESIYMAESADGYPHAEAPK